MEPYYDDGIATIYHADCRDVLPEIDPATTVLLTDPPYGINHVSKWLPKDRRLPRVRNDEDTTLRDDVIAWHSGGAALVFASWKRSLPIGVRAVLVWDKGKAVGMGDLSIPWKPNFELICVIGSGFHGQRDSGVLCVPSLPQRIHPTEKPVGLIASLLVKCPEGLILDPFMGAGSTLVAAKEQARRVVGIEIDERYCEIAAERLSRAETKVA